MTLGYKLDETSCFLKNCTEYWEANIGAEKSPVLYVNAKVNARGVLRVCPTRMCTVQHHGHHRMPPLGPEFS